MAGGSGAGMFSNSGLKSTVKGESSFSWGGAESPLGTLVHDIGPIGGQMVDMSVE